MLPAQSHDARHRTMSAGDLARLHSWAQVALQRFVDAILQPYTFLAAIIWFFGGSYGDIAIIAIAAAISLSLGTIVMPFTLARTENIRLVVLGANVVRVIASIIVVLIGWRAETLSPSDFVLWVVMAMLFYQVSSATNVSRNPRSFIANLDQPTSARSRQAVGALAGIFGGLVSWRALGNRDFSLEQSAGMLLFLAGFASLGSVWFQITAPLRYQDIHQKLPVPSGHDIQQVIRTPGVRKFLWVRLILGLSTLVDPFLIVFGIDELHLQPQFVGAAMMALVVAQVLGGSIWTLLGETPGSRSSIQVAALLRLAALALAVSIPFFGSSRWYAETFSSPRPASWIFVTVFLLLGLSQTTLVRNETHYLMHTLKDGRLYPAMDAVLNAVLVLIAFMPAIGVWMINSLGLQSALTIATTLALTGLLSTSFLMSRKRLPRRRLETEKRRSLRPVRKRPAQSRPVNVKRMKR